MRIEDREFIQLLKNEVKPAQGCTEPIAVALAVARSSEEIHAKGEKVEFVDIELSPNILKNAMGVGIPGTDMIGLNIASALGIVCGKSAYELEVLKDVNDEFIAEAKKYVDSDCISITLADTDKMLYIKATTKSANHTACAIIEDKHNNITKVEIDGIVVLDKQQVNSSAAQHDSSEECGASHKLTVRAIYDFATTVDFADIAFILESGKMNRTLAEEGLNKDYGLRVGRTIQNNIKNHVMGDCIMTHAMSLTAAASDARMAGSKLPAMSNSGSGNQGLTATLPVVATAEKLNSSREQLARALVISHLISIHIKQSLGRLSALCGCVVASSGSSCGVVYLAGGSYEQMTYAIKNMVGNIAGMVCDGAKVGCALKVSSGVSASVQSAMLAMQGVSVTENDGIIDDDIEKTIENLSIIGTKGMHTTDQVMLEIMVDKKKRTVS